MNLDMSKLVGTEEIYLRMAVLKCIMVMRIESEFACKRNS